MQLAPNVLLICCSETLRPGPQTTFYTRQASPGTLNHRPPLRPRILLRPRIPLRPRIRNRRNRRSGFRHVTKRANVGIGCVRLVLGDRLQVTTGNDTGRRSFHPRTGSVRYGRTARARVRELNQYSLSFYSLATQSQVVKDRARPGCGRRRGPRTGADRRRFRRPRSRGSGCRISRPRTPGRRRARCRRAWS